MNTIIGISIALFILTLLLLLPYGRRLAGASRKSTPAKGGPGQGESSNARIAAGGKQALEKMLRQPSSPPPEPIAPPSVEGSMEEVFRNTGVVHLDEVRFDGRSANLRRESLPVLDEMAAVLQKEPGSRILVQGSSNGNIMLAERRARSVVRYLVSQGVEQRRLESTGIVANAGRLKITPEEVMRNRRVTISRMG